MRIYTNFAHIAVSLQRQSLVPSPSTTTHTLRLWRRSAARKGSRLWTLTTTETTMSPKEKNEVYGNSPATVERVVKKKSRYLV